MRFEYEISKLLSLAICLVNFLLMLSIELNTGPGPYSIQYFINKFEYFTQFSAEIKHSTNFGIQLTLELAMFITLTKDLFIMSFLQCIIQVLN